MTQPNDWKLISALEVTSIATRALVELYAMSGCDRDRMVESARVANEGMPDEVLHETGYTMQGLVACNLAHRAISGYLDMLPADYQPSANMVIVDSAGERVDPDSSDVDRLFAAQMRMGAAMLNRDPAAAMDVFIAFERTDPDRTAELVVDLIEQAYLVTQAGR